MDSFIEKGGPRLVVIGNGMAGVRMVEELLGLAPDAYEIAIFGDEPHPNYNRILLSPVLAGEKTFDQIVLNPRTWYAEHGIALHTGSRVTGIDRAQHCITAADGRQMAYDKLVIATGSHPFVPPMPGADLGGVVGYRDMHDTDTMLAAAQQHRHAVVIGGGLLGLEAANGLACQGMDVTVVHIAPWLMERQLDNKAAALLQRSLEARGIRFMISARTTSLKGNVAGSVEAVVLADGSEIPAELVVMAAGIRPNLGLAQAAGLACGRGIRVNDGLQTETDPDIYAVGECAEHRNVVYGLVAPLYEQAKVLARQLAGDTSACYCGSEISTKLKVTGIDLFSAGDFMGDDGTETLLLDDAGSGVYKKLVLRENHIVGACIYGDTTDGNWYFKLLKEKQPIGDIRSRLLFGQAATQTAEGSAIADPVLLMEDSDEVCGCNGVCKGTIVDAIRVHHLKSVDEVRRFTKASSSCGSCTGMVEHLLAHTLGDGYTAQNQRAKPMCGCTELTHAQVRTAIHERHLTSIPQVIRELAWHTQDGCATCRPALNYYLISTWPHEAIDDPQSRFVNERNHANIQKDGTYSVVPRMWGGVTSPAELRVIADVAEKYQVPTVKMTGGQRIDLLGIRQEQLPSVWADLNAAGMVSGHAYGKSLRTVKTCVGKEHCRFGTQYAIALGIKLEKMLFGMWSPHKVKLAVSGCPRNCSECGIKDVGIVGVDSGYDIYVAGNGGIKTEVAQKLCHAADDDEVLEITAAFLQLYRVEAFYLERTVHYVTRVGLDHVKDQVVTDLRQRAALAGQLKDALANATDPWAEERDGARRQRYVPLVLAATLA